ncbi:MAG: tetratricopeptide repeat protein, partial [Cyclobacteriaceae bacterium]|nr:tetratricopeptide repeat protein [Cyclobacteriaceae bacterium]
MIPKKILCLLIFLVCIFNITFGQDNYSGKKLTTEEYLKLASKYEKEGDIKEATRYINTIGIIAWEEKDYSNAIDFFNRSIALNELIDNKGGISKLHSNLGMIYSDIEDYEKSLDYFQQALDYRLEFGERTEIISTYINKAVVLNSLEQY